MDSEYESSPLDGECARWERIAAVVLTSTRRDLDVSQRELAARMGWTRNMIANLEAHRRNVKLTDFLLIARALNVNPEVLLQQILGGEQGQRTDRRESNA